jgi:hypothetical protein
MFPLWQYLNLRSRFWYLLMAGNQKLFIFSGDKSPREEARRALERLLARSTCPAACAEHIFFYDYSSVI